MLMGTLQHGSDYSGLCLLLNLRRAIDLLWKVSHSSLLLFSLFFSIELEV
jgi:hypothetical protein